MRTAEEWQSRTQHLVSGHAWKNSEKKSEKPRTSVSCVDSNTVGTLRVGMLPAQRCIPWLLLLCCRREALRTHRRQACLN